MIERAQAIAWRTRWAAVNEETAREIRGMSPTERLRTLAMLRRFGASGHVSPWPDDDAEVRARWARLRARYDARRASR
jgi:hypothetical protein